MSERDLETARHIWAQLDVLHGPVAVVTAYGIIADALAAARAEQRAADVRALNDAELTAIRERDALCDAVPGFASDAVIDRRELLRRLDAALAELGGSRR